MEKIDECCLECAHLRRGLTADPRCSLRQVDILDPAWTLCRNFTTQPCPDARINGPIYIDAGAFPDHLKPVNDWSAYLRKERAKRDSNSSGT